MFGRRRDNQRQGTGAAAAADGRGITRRRFATGTALAIGAGIATISLTSCGNDKKKQTTGEPQVVTDDSQVISVLDGDYANVDNPLVESGSWTLPLGTLLFHTGGTWAAAMLTPESSLHINTLGTLSLSSGNMVTLLESPAQGRGFDFFDVRCSDEVYAWVEINYTDRSWALLGQGFSSGSLTGDPVQLDSGDVDWEPPRFTVWGSSVIWQKMPLATGEASSEDSHCYRWTLGDTEGSDLWTSHGRFATSPRVSNGILTIAPRVRGDEGVYYGMTAIDLTDDNNTQVDQLVLPRTVAPFTADYMNESFVFSIEASYNGLGSLGNMGTFVGREGGPYTYVRREPLSAAVGNGSRLLVKAQASNFVIDLEEHTYATLHAPDRSLDFGEWPATEGASERFLSYATVRNDQGVPESVVARVFSI